jgi:hypothetical protein
VEDSAWQFWFLSQTGGIQQPSLEPIEDINPFDLHPMADFGWWRWGSMGCKSCNKPVWVLRSVEKSAGQQFWFLSPTGGIQPSWDSKIIASQPHDKSLDTPHGWFGWWRWGSMGCKSWNELV